MSEAKDIIKQGEVVLKTGLLKQKHKRWCELGKAKGGKCFTLEFYENSEQKDKVKNAFELFQVKTIDKVIKESSKDYYIDVHLKKDKFSLIFSGQSETESWYNFLQENSLFCDGREDSTNLEDDLTLKDNILYDSQPDETARFDVSLEPNADAERLGLYSKYRLHVSNACLMLEDLETKESKIRWYYDKLRKYGMQNKSFIIVAGRHSETGEGTFVFIHDNPGTIAKTVDTLAKRKHEGMLLKKLYSKEADSENDSRNLEPEISSVIPKSLTCLKDNDCSDLQVAVIRQLSSHLLPNQAEEATQKPKQVKSAKSKKNTEKKKDTNPKDAKNGKDLKRGTSDCFDEYEAVGNSTDKKTVPKLCELFDEKKPSPPSSESLLYEQVDIERSNAWKTHGIINQEHTESEFQLQFAAMQKGKQTIETSNDSDIDDTYDHAFLNNTNIQMKKPDTSVNIYGTESGREVTTLESDYDLVEDKPPEYNDAASINTPEKIQPQCHIRVHYYEDVELPFNARFDVTLKPNEDTERLCLKSKYRLHVSNVCLMLEDLNTQTPKYRWYYEHLRKYGKQGPNFTIVAGRRSSSGEGMFIFIHDDPAKIVKAIDSLTKRKHNEQLTNKLNFKETNSDNRAENRKSEPILTPNSSPIPPKKSGSLKDDSNSKEALTRQNSAHLSPNFKHELEETVLKGKPIEKAKSKKDKHESKDDKKKGFTLFNKKEKKQKDSKNGQDNKEQKEERLYDEPEAPIHAPPTEPIYEEADQNIGQTRSLVTNKQSVEPSLYAQANTDRTSAWRRHGLQDEEHMENYDSIKAAASQKGKQKIPNRIDSDDSDDTYDHAFLNLKNVQKRKSDPSTNIYGTASGKEVSIPEADYELDDEEPVAYYDAVSAKTLGQTQTQLPSQEYEEVDIQH